MKQLSNQLPDTLKKQLEQLAKTHPSHAKHCSKLIKQLGRGAPYTLLGGKKIQNLKGYVRFKIGQRYRFIAVKKHGQWSPLALLSHANYDNLLKRR